MAVSDRFADLCGWLLALLRIYQAFAAAITEARGSLAVERDDGLQPFAQLVLGRSFGKRQTSGGRILVRFMLNLGLAGFCSRVFVTETRFDATRIELL